MSAEIGEVLREFAARREDLKTFVELLLSAVADESIALSEDQGGILENAILDVTHDGAGVPFQRALAVIPIATWLNTLGIKHLLNRR